MNPEYLVPSMVNQCAEAFNNNGSTIQLHRFLKVALVGKMGLIFSSFQLSKHKIRPCSVVEMSCISYAHPKNTF